ncbi:MAG: hypothetical protein U1F43_08075 [Myxococcota bacterium]
MRKMMMASGWIVASVLGFSALTACGGGGPCAKSVEATAKYGTGEEKKMAVDMKDNFIKACEMGLKQSPEMGKMLECEAAATDEKSFNERRKM